jgi:hypothetical protein
MQQFGNPAAQAHSRGKNHGFGLGVRKQAFIFKIEIGGSVIRVRHGEERQGTAVTDLNPDLCEAASRT